MESYRSILGTSSSSVGSAAISGPGSTWTITDQLRAGNQQSAQGELSIQNGGAVSTSFVAAGFIDNAQGTVTVDGLNSTLTSSGELRIGGASGGSPTGALTIQNRRRARSADRDTDPS